MENKHTEGRWYLQEYTDVYTNIIRCDNGKGMETIYIADIHGRGCNNRENARLMAAAPELLEALIEAKEVLLQLNHNGNCYNPANGSDCECTLCKIDKAINKATE